ncbi:response regulator [Microbacterium amylolyticum]|uniref:DNA-binding NarL/FixJ family response regulator n=1 Tax=Microbacterium amylolyticum TaxID=936337 RepID=A0ABS4ZEV1_9MICO|nr:response regulator transcription factor [Microbacterium amylolyticum]MBP2435809.1 DNA-binding NarL/FixJ family response regulator [Microbacterium amylolyticum]
MSVRVIIVDDQTLVRQGIRGLLGISDEVDVVAEASDGAEALEKIAEVSPDVVLLDLRMPGMDGIATLEAMRAADITVPVLVLTTFDDAELVLGAMRAGARGYLLKDVTLEQLVGGIRTVASGGTLLQPAMTERLIKAVSTAPDPADSGGPIERLTERETDVLHLIAGGYSNREIAQMLHLAEGTVKNHVSMVLMKLQARDRTQAVLRALHAGVLG